MFVTKMALPRRTFLRGAGVTLALPLLDAMVPALTATSKSAAAAPPRAKRRWKHRPPPPPMARSNSAPSAHVLKGHVHLPFTQVLMRQTPGRQPISNDARGNAPTSDAPMSNAPTSTRGGILVFTACNVARGAPLLQRRGSCPNVRQSSRANERAPSRTRTLSR